MICICLRRRYIFAFNQIAVKERITFRLESDESGIDAWFDRVLLEKVFFNLLSNAFKHTAPDESITIRLQLFSVAGLQEQFPGRISGEVRGTSRYVCLSVEDTGKGIDDSDKFHIFSPFYQGTDESESNTAGTGIGLSLVLSIVKLHKGVVWVEDNKPKGAVFRVLIPINREAYAHEQFAEDDSSARNPYGGIEVAEDESKVPDNMQEQLPVSGRRYTLLLAEDNPDVRRYICKHLEPYFDVLEAENGVDAFNKIAETLPDLVVSDIMMPKKRRLATLFGDQAGFADRTYPGYHHYGEIDGDAYQRGISVWCGRLYREAFQYGGPAVSYSEYFGFS